MGLKLISKVPELLNQGINLVPRWIIEEARYKILGGY